MPKKHYVFMDYISALFTQQMLAAQGKHYQIGQLDEGGFILFRDKARPDFQKINYTLESRLQMVNRAIETARQYTENLRANEGGI